MSRTSCRQTLALWIAAKTVGSLRQLVPGLDNESVGDFLSAVEAVRQRGCFKDDQRGRRNRACLHAVESSANSGEKSCVVLASERASTGAAGGSGVTDET